MGRVVYGNYQVCKGCGLLFPASVLNADQECTDCEHYDARDHDPDPYGEDWGGDE